MKAVIYDLDGVIVDTARYHYLGWKKLADQIGVDFDEEKNEKLKGVGRRDSLIMMLGYTPEEKQIEEWCDLKNKYYLDYIENINSNDILPGSISMLKQIINSSDWKQALASSSKNANTILHKLDIEKYFDAVVNGSELQNSKPDPEIFLKAAFKLDLNPDEVIVVEDAESGVAAAKAAGMKVIGIGDKEILSKADLVVNNLSEITLKNIDELLKTGVIIK